MFYTRVIFSLREVSKKPRKTNLSARLRHLKGDSVHTMHNIAVATRSYNPPTYIGFVFVAHNVQVVIFLAWKTCSLRFFAVSNWMKSVRRRYPIVLQRIGWIDCNQYRWVIWSNITSLRRGYVWLSAAAAGWANNGRFSVNKIRREQINPEMRKSRSCINSRRCGRVYVLSCVSLWR